MYIINHIFNYVNFYVKFYFYRFYFLMKSVYGHIFKPQTLELTGKKHRKTLS